MYEYYRNVLSYPETYPAVYGTVREVNRPSEDTLDVEILAPLEKPSETDQFITKFKFFPYNEIRYEVISGYGKGKIRKSILIKEPSDHAIRTGCECEVEVNHLPLDIMKLDPHALDATNHLHMRYIEMVSYLSTQDQIHLEGKGSLDEVRDCPNCKGVKSVRRTGRVEMDKGKKTVWLQCDICNKTFRNISVQVSNHIEIRE